MPLYPPKRILTLVVTLSVFCAMAQKPLEDDKIEVLSPKGTNVGQLGLVIYKHTGNVKLRHRRTLLFCDHVVHYVAVNRIEAFGHVLISQGDTITVKADTLIFDGNKSQASLRGHVMFQDQRTVLTTSRLAYNLSSGVAQYTNRGRLVDGGNVLTSLEGYYDVRSRQTELQHAVRLVNPETILTADVLIYNTGNRMATFVEPTRIAGKEGVSVARQGQYDTQANQLSQSTTTETLKYVSNNLAIASVSNTITSVMPLVTSAGEAVATNQDGQPVATKELAVLNKVNKKSIGTALAANEKALSWQAVLNQAKASRASADTITKTSIIPTEVTLTLSGKSLAAAVPESVKPLEASRVISAKAPAKKMKEPIAVATVHKEVIAVKYAAEPQPERVAKQPVIVTPAKSAVAPIKQTNPADEVSDLEKELNHKKRSYAY